MAKELIGGTRQVKLWLHRAWVFNTAIWKLAQDNNTETIHMRKTDMKCYTNLQPPQTGDCKGSIPCSIKSIALDAQNTFNLKTKSQWMTNRKKSHEQK